MDFEDRLSLLVERELLWKENRALTTRIQYAGFKMTDGVENIDYQHPRGLKRAQIEQLRAGDWVGNFPNCLITGPTGSGKTYLACTASAFGTGQGYADFVRIGLRPISMINPFQNSR